jgi:hypothetical protein
MFFRRERFIENGVFDFKAYAGSLGGFCNKGTCPHFRAGRNFIKEISLGEWRKCPGHCITCTNHAEHADERILSPVEIRKYMEDLSQTYKEVATSNAAEGAPPPAIVIGAAGDLFYSENYRNLLCMRLADFGIREIKLITSLQTWTLQNCERIHPGNYPLVKEIIISLDSATPQLYETIRAGSKWHNLIRGYERATALFPNAAYKLSVTVSKANFTDVQGLPEKVPELFPKVACIEYHAVADWTGQPDMKRLLLDPAEKAYIERWCAEHDGKYGIPLKFLY